MDDALARLMSGLSPTRRAARARNTIQVVGNGGPYTVYRDCAILRPDVDLPDLLSTIIANLNFSAVNECDRFAIHAGVVGWQHGLVALPAESGHGKTTLTAALVQQGFDYLSDEALVFDDAGSVVPYPKPIALSEWSAGLLELSAQGEETLVTASDLGSSVGRGGELTDLIISEFGHERVTIDPIARSQAVAALVQYSFNHYKNPQRAFRIATDVARQVRVWRLHYDDPIEAAGLIAKTLS